MNNAVFRDVTPCGSCTNRHFEGTYRLRQGGKNSEQGTTLEICLRSMLHLPDSANVVPTSLIILTFMMEALSSSETSDFTRATRHHISEDGIFHSLP
jgi:hypothetical protein